MQSALLSRDSEAALRPAMDSANEDWWTMLAKWRAWSPEEGAVLGIAPHPNDEILGAGGLIRPWAAYGRPVSVLSVADGEAADPGLDGLANLRREELRAAFRKICPTPVFVTPAGIPG